MDRSRLPLELERVERLLASAPRPEPSATLRRLLLNEVREELRHCVLHRLRTELLREQRRASRRLAFASAAALLLAVGVSLGVMRAAGVPLKTPAAAPRVVDVAWQLQQLSPQLSQRDSLLQAALRQVGPDAACGDILKDLFPDREKGEGDRHLLPERPFGCCAQKVPVPFSRSKSHDR